MTQEKSKNTADAMENAALPEAYMLNVAEGSEGETGAAERHSDPAAKTPAEWAFDRIALYIEDFEKRLNPDEEVAMGFAGSDAGSLRIDGMGYFAPDLITFYGHGPDGKPVQLVQHVSQLNVMLVAEPKPKDVAKANRIGFKLRHKTE